MLCGTAVREWLRAWGHGGIGGIVSLVQPGIGIHSIGQLNFKLQHFPVRQLAGPDRSGNFPDRTDPATSQRHAIVSNAIIPQH